MIFLVFDFLLLSRKNTRKRKSTFYVSVVAFFVIIGTYLLFVQHFLVDDFSIVEVYSHSSSSLPFVSKVYAAWAGGGGSLLLLTLCLGVVYFGFRVWADREPEEFQIFSGRVMGIITAFFLLMCIFKNPFATFEIAPQEGGGLNPALQTPWMAVHPPIVFIAYAFLALAFVLVLAGMRTGKQTEEKLLKLSTRLSWLFFTIGIALGGLWAYEVLGWGGYWSWDPIETSSLLPWFALTVFFHFDRIQGTRRALSREFMILLAFDDLIFLSALTRGVLLMSVHAYAFSPAGPVLLLFALGVTLYFFYLQRKTGKNLFQLNYDKTSTEAVSTFLGVLATLAVFIVCFVGVAAPLVHSPFTTEPFTPSTGFYNIGTLPFVLTLLPPS